MIVLAAATVVVRDPLLGGPGRVGAREACSGPVTRALIAADYTHLDRTQAPLPVGYRLYFEAGQPAEGGRQWPADRRAEGPGRMVLVAEAP